MTGSSLEKAWLAYVDEHGHLKPDRAQHTLTAANVCADFFYDDYNLAVFIDGPAHETAQQRAKDEAIDRRLDELGFIVVRFSRNTQSWPAVFAAHADLFGPAKTRQT